MRPSAVERARRQAVCGLTSMTAKRDPELLATVGYDRALAYEQAGQKARGRADFERLYANDPGYQDVRERLRAAARFRAPAPDIEEMNAEIERGYMEERSTG